MNPFLVARRKVGPMSSLSRSALVCAVSVALALGAALAQSNQGTVGVSTGDEFRRQLEDFKLAAPDLNTKIENSAKTIDELTDARKAREEIEQLRGVIAELLGRVSDNGELGRLGARALTQFREKLQSLSQDVRFAPEEKQYLIDQWRQLIKETERAADDLEHARSEFADLLRMLQNRQDYIDELIQLQRASEAINVIRQLTKEIRQAKVKLDSLINGIKPPGV
jgi:DNA repair exonuclease SbcCD ATPase subunit